MDNGKQKVGRPKGSTKENHKEYKTFSIACSPAEWVEIKRLSEKAEKSVSRFLVEKALESPTKCD